MHFNSCTFKMVYYMSYFGNFSSPPAPAGTPPLEFGDGDFHYPYSSGFLCPLKKCIVCASNFINISIFFSKLTLHSDCCHIVSNQPISFKTFLYVLHRHHKKEVCNSMDIYISDDLVSCDMLSYVVIDVK